MWSILKRKTHVSIFPINVMKVMAEESAKKDVQSGVVSSATTDIPHSESLIKQEVEVHYKSPHDHYSREDDRLRGILQPLFNKLTNYYQSLNEIRARLKGRPLQVYIPFWLYSVIVIFLVVTEFFFNFKVFSTVMRGSDIESGLLAVGTTGAVLAIAHFAGLKIRHGKVVMGSVLIFLCIVLIVAFAGVRIGDVEYEQAKNKGGKQTFESMQFDNSPAKTPDSKDVDQGGSSQKGQQRSIFNYVSHSTLVVLFFMINLAFLIVGILCSFYSHDPDEDYQSVIKAFSKTLGKVSTVYHQRKANATQWENTYRETKDQYQRVIDIYRAKIQELVKGEVDYVRRLLNLPNEEDRYLPLDLPPVAKWQDEPQMKEIEQIFENSLGVGSNQFERKT